VICELAQLSVFIPDCHNQIVLSMAGLLCVPFGVDPRIDFRPMMCLAVMRCDKIDRKKAFLC
jgi:hypothetical protein